MRFVALKPTPDPVGLLFPRVDPQTTRRAAVLLRDPWEIHRLDDTEFAPYLDELEAAIAAFTEELTKLGRSPPSGRGPIIPDSMKAAGERQMAAVPNLVKPILQKTGRKLSSFEPWLPPDQYRLLHAHLFLAELLQAGERIEASVARGRQIFERDPDLQDAIVRRLEVIGECVKVLSRSPRGSHLRLPVGGAAAMSEILAHDPVGIDLNVVWQTASEDIPKLMAALRAEAR